MDYKEFQEQIVDYLSDNLSEEERQRFEECLKENPQYQEELEAAQFLWSGNEEEMPEPSMAMDAKFYSLLDAEMKEDQKTTAIQLLLNQVERSNSDER